MHLIAHSTLFLPLNHPFGLSTLACLLCSAKTIHCHSSNTAKPHTGGTFACSIFSSFLIGRNSCLPASRDNSYNIPSIQDLDRVVGLLYPVWGQSASIFYPSGYLTGSSQLQISNPGDESGAQRFIRWKQWLLVRERLHSSLSQAKDRRAEG